MKQNYRSGQERIEKMNTINKHPVDDELYEYSREPELSRFFNLRSHLLGCPSCQKRLNNIQQAEQWIFHNSAVQRSTSADLAKSVSVDQTLKEALHKTAHTIAMQRAEEQNAQHGSLTENRNTKPQHTKQKLPFLLRLRGLFNHKVSLFLSVPGTALATIVLAVTLLPYFSNDSNELSIVAYQDNPNVVFTSQQSTGIGFFNAANERSLPFDGAVISMNEEGKLFLEWPPVPGAQSYMISLFKAGPAAKQEIATMSSKDNYAQFAKVALDSGQRYVWELSGSTVEGGHFRAQGGFVVAK